FWAECCSPLQELLRSRGESEEAAFALFQKFRGIEHSVHLYHPRDEARPAGLVTRTESRAIVAMEVFVEQDVVAPMRVGLELFRPAEHRSPTLLIAQEDAGKAARDLLAHLE